MAAPTRQQQIRQTLTAQYQSVAADEVLVATLRYEMSSLTHNHRWADGTRFTGKPLPYGRHQCIYCFCGTDEYVMTLDEILVKARASEMYSDQVLAEIAGPAGS